MEEQQQKRKTKTELPDDIIQDEILTRLPLKPLLRFQCVCKSWLSLFSDSDFVKAHLSRHQHYSNETRIRSIPFLSNCLFIGSINGIICFAHPEVFRLWNPAFRQHKEVSIASGLHGRECKDIDGWDPTKDIYRRCNHLYGFAWDPTRNDYKVVIVCSVSPDSKHGAVYSCNSDSWTELVLPTSIFGFSSRSFIKNPHPTTIVKECPYWSYSKYLRLPGKNYKRRYTVVFKFVAEKNEFRLLPDFDCYRQQGLKLINLKGRLAGMAYKLSRQFPFHKRFVDIYSLDHEGSGGVWSKMYTLGATDFGFLSGKRSCGKLEFRELKQLLCYDPKTKEIKGVVDSTPFRSDLFTYTPSLVFIHGMKPILHSKT